MISKFILKFLIIVSISMFSFAATGKAQVRLNTSQILSSFNNGNSAIQQQAIESFANQANLSLKNAENILQNLKIGNVNLNISENLLDQMIQGNISPQLGQVLSLSQQLSRIQSFSDIGKLLNDPSIQQALSQVLPGNIGETLSALGAIAGGLEGLQQLATPAGAAALASMLEQVSPQLAATLSQALGGQFEIASAILNAAIQQISNPTNNPEISGSSSSSGGSGEPTACPPGEKYQLFDPKCKPDALCTIEPDAGCKVPCHCAECRPIIEANHKTIRAHVTGEFVKHRNWMIDEFFTKHILPAMAMMTSQLSTVAVQQVKIVGKFFDAKHQLETQRLFQQLMAEAHKDYQPSEGMCEIGTLTRSLATSSRKADLGHVAFANRVMERELRTGDIISSAEANSDIYSRIDMFVKKHCNKKDNSHGLNWLCSKENAPKEQKNKDVDFTRTIESKLTLDIDFTKDKSKATADEEDVFALTANLFAHDVLPVAPRLIIATADGRPREEAHRYMDLRSIAAKRSVAQNSFTAMTAERVQGDQEVAKFLKKTLAELGIKDDEIEVISGENPSYFAQMEVLTKNIFQNPAFYTELYDKPANVLRKGAAIRSIGLMQERDLYKSQLRSEAVLAVLLETMLLGEHGRVSQQLTNLEPGGEKALPGGVK